MAATPARRARLPAAVWALLLLTHALACAYALCTGRYVFPDTDRYVQAAGNLAQHGQLYARPWPPAPGSAAVQEFTIRPPGYPLLLAALGQPVGTLLLQNLLSVAALALVLGRWAASRARPPGWRAWAAALALALSFPAQLIYANAVMSEVSLQALVLLGAGLAVAFGRTGRARYLAGVAGVLVAAELTKPVWFPFAAVFLLVAGWLSWRQRRWRLAALGALPLLAALAYMGWNGQRTGYAHFSSITDINLLHYNAYGTLMQARGPVRAEAWLDSALLVANGQPSFVARQRTMQAAAGAVLRRYPVRYAGQHLLGMANFFLDPGRFDLSVWLGEGKSAGLLSALRGRGVAGVAGALARQPLALLLALALTALANAGRLVLAVHGFRRAVRRPAGAGRGEGAWPWVAAGLLLYVALLTGPLGAARFLVPVWPLLLALALRGLPEGPARW